MTSALPIESPEIAGVPTELLEQLSKAPPKSTEPSPRSWLNLSGSNSAAGATEEGPPGAVLAQDVTSLPANSATLTATLMVR